MALPYDVLTSAIDFGVYLGGDGSSSWSALAGRLTPVHPETFRPIDLLHVESGDVITSSGVFFEVEIGSTQSPQIVRSGTGALYPDDFLWSMQFAGWGDSPPNRVFALPAASDDVVDYDRFAPAESRPQVLVPVVTSVEAVTEAQAAADEAAASAAAVQSAVATSAALAAAAQEAAEAAAALVDAAQAAAQSAADAAAGAITPAQLTTALASINADLAAATELATVSTLARRDSAGRLVGTQVRATNSTPAGASDLTRKDYVDALGATAATPSTVVRRDAAGIALFTRAFSSAQGPTDPSELIRRDYADALGTSAATNDTVMRRDGSGGTFVSAIAITNGPTAGTHGANKTYVDSIGLATATSNTIVRRASDARFDVATPTSAAHPTRKDYVDLNGSSMPADIAPASGAVNLAGPTFTGPIQRNLTLAGNITLASVPPTPATGRSVIVRLIWKQAAAGTGPFTLTWPATSVLPWSQGLSAPVMPTAAGAEQMVELVWTGLRWVASLVWTD